MKANQVPSLPPDYVGHLSGETLTALLHHAQAAGRRIVTIDLSACRNKKEVLTTIGVALEFPAHYGANFDALVDCLSDLSAPQGWLIVLQQLAEVPAMRAQARALLLDCFRDAAAFHLAQSRVFQVLWN